MAEQPTADQQSAAVNGEDDALDELDAALADETAAGETQWTPPTREEFEAMQAAHQAELEKEQAKRRRASEQAKRLREGRTAPAQQQGEDGEQQPGPDPQLAVWQQRAVRAAAKAQLLERGADTDMVDLALARLRGEQIEFDADDEPILEDWLDEMEDRYPKLFTKQQAGMSTSTGPRPVGRVDQGKAAARPAPPKLSLGEQIIANSESARIRARRG